MTLSDANLSIFSKLVQSTPQKKLHSVHQQTKKQPKKVDMWRYQ